MCLKIDHLNTLSAIFGAGFTFLANFIFKSVTLPSADFFISSLVTINLYVSFVGFGIGLFWLNIYGIEGSKAVRWLLPTLRLVFVLACLAITSILLLLIFEGSNINKFIFSLIPWLLALVLNDLAAAKLQLQNKFNLLSSWLLFPHLSRIIVALYLASVGGGLIDIANGFFLYDYLGKPDRNGPRNNPQQFIVKEMKLFPFKYHPLSMFLRNLGLLQPQAFYIIFFFKLIF